MSSIRNAVSRRAHKERSQPHDRQKFGILEKHKDYVVRAKAYHKKEETLRVLKEKAASRNPDEFYFKMMNSRVVDGVHRKTVQKNEYTPDETMLINTQDTNYVLHKIQKEKKEIEKLSSTLHFLDKKPCNKHKYFADDREEAKEIQLQLSQMKKSSPVVEVPGKIKRKIASSYKQLEAHKKKGTKRKLREDELIIPTSKPVYKWKMERKR